MQRDGATGHVSDVTAMSASAAVRPQTTTCTSTHDMLASSDDVCELTGRPYSAAAAALQHARRALPIYVKKHDIQDVVCRHRVVLLVGETGSGKTTQVPRFLAELPVSRLHSGNSGGSACGQLVVACTQPRRLAAVSVATRVAAEADVPLGHEVGYHVRFGCAATSRTRVLYLTDGMLLRQAAAAARVDDVNGSDKRLTTTITTTNTTTTTTTTDAAALSCYDVVVVDEAHERAVDTDVVLGLLKRLLPQRPQLRVVVMSATLDVDTLRRFFPAAPLLQVSGRMYDVTVRYMPRPVSDYVEAAVACATQIHVRQPAGDVLVFLTGEAEIERAVAATRRQLEACGCACVAAIDASDDASSSSSSNNATSRDAVSSHHDDDHGVGVKRARRDDTDDDVTTSSSSSSSTQPTRAVVLPLYGSLSLPAQQRVFATYHRDTRKIVFATNIAETSLTIDGVVYVVDCGYQKQTLYHASARVDYLLPAVISKAAAEQRRGRAGRTRAGICYRLYTHDEYTRLFPPHTHPAMLRSNVVNTVLTLLQLGVTNVCAFDFLDAPPHDSLEDAFYQLVCLGAVDGETLQLTPLGRRMAALPVDVSLARMLLMADKHGCGSDAAVVAAMLEATGGGGAVFVRPPGHGGDADAARARFADAAGDHVTLFRVFHAYYRHAACGVAFCREHYLRHQTLQQAVLVYTQLRRVMAACNIAAVSTYDATAETLDTVALRRALLEGFFLQVAHYTATTTTTTATNATTTTTNATTTVNAAQQRTELCYRTVREAMPVKLHWQSVLQPRTRRLNAWTATTTATPSHAAEWVMYDRLAVHAVDEGSFMRCVSPIDVDWLLDVSDVYTHADDVADADAALALRNAARRRAALSSSS